MIRQEGSLTQTRLHSDDLHKFLTTNFATWHSFSLHAQVNGNFVTPNAHFTEVVCFFSLYRSELVVETNGLYPLFQFIQFI